MADTETTFCALASWHFTTLNPSIRLADTKTIDESLGWDEAFRRRKLVDLGPALGEVYLHSPEDLILYKLWYYSLSQQTKHLRDISAIVMTIQAELDYDYIQRWAVEKGTNTLWDEILESVDMEERE